jgi:hypothetical protein
MAWGFATSAPVRQYAAAQSLSRLAWAFGHTSKGGEGMVMMPAAAALGRDHSPGKVFATAHTLDASRFLL